MWNTETLVEVIKVTTDELNHNVVSFSQHDLPKGALQILIRITPTLVPELSFMSLRRDTIRSLKDKIFHEIRSLPSMQKLFFAGVELIDNHRTFSDYNIPCRATIDLVLRHMGQIPIAIKTCMAPWALTQLFFNPRTTIRRVKAVFRYKTGRSTNQLRLVYAGHELHDSYTLADYCVQYGASLWLINNRIRMPEGFLKIYVLIDSTKKLFHLLVNYLCTISNLKAMIEENEGIPAHLQTLFMPRKRLLDGSSTIADNYIYDEIFIHVVQETMFEDQNEAI